MEQKKRITIETIISWIAGIFAFLGFAVFFGYLIKLYSDGYVFYGKVNLQMGSWVGDFLAGFAGTIWAFVTLLLLFLTLRIQQKIGKKQQIDTTFFNMLNLLQEIIRFMTKKDKLGREYIQEVFNSLKNRGRLDTFINDRESNKYDSEIEEYKKEALRIYEEIYKENQAQLGHYFRFVYNIIKYILENEDDFNAQKKYIDLIQAQMSNYELGLIFYNALSKYGGNKFHGWLDKYQMLENIDRSCLLKPELDYKLYPNTTFKYLTL